jgi:hypothetical protein
MLRLCLLHLSVVLPQQYLWKIAKSFKTLYFLT